MSGKGFYIPSLDGMRCVAILLVFGSHVLMASGRPNFFPGSFGVTVFFFLSGFLITTLLRIEHERTGRVDVGKFYLRRALRIFPPMYIVLAIAIVSGAWQNAHSATAVMNGWYVLGQVFHLTNYLIVWKGGFSVAVAPETQIYWSLAVEEHFYLLFPWMFIGLARLGSRRTQAQVLLALCGLVLLWRCWLLFGAGVGVDRIYVASDTRADSILFGCALALWGNPALDPTRLRPATWKWVLLPLGLAGIVVSLLVKTSWFLESFRYTLQGICLVPVYVTAVRYPGWGPMRLLNLGWVRWIGVFSYTIYLFHQTAIRWCVWLFGRSLPATALVGGALTLAVAAAMYFGIERRAAGWRRRLSPAPEPAR